MSKPTPPSLTLQTVASKPREHAVDGAPAVGLYFTSPMQTSGYEFPIQLGQAFRQVNKSHYEKNMHVLELCLPILTEEEIHKNTDLIAQICRNSGIVFIVKSRLDLMEQYKADGIIFTADEAPDLEEVRKKYGEELLIGIDCKACKETAIRYIDQPALDYVTFDYYGEEALELLEYWKTRSDKPCAVRGYITPEVCEELVHFGVDFIGCGDYVWEQKEQVATAVEEISTAIEEALSGRNVQ